MTDNPSIINPNRNLDYQFYFLFRTHLWKEEQYIQEPFHQFGELQEMGIQIDTDKRLFRPETPANMPLADWQTHFNIAWNHILEQYSQAFHPEQPPQAISEQARLFCQDNLLGVALLIMDETLEKHEVTLDLYDSQNQPLGEACFRHNNNVLLSIRDKVGFMPQPATFHAFTPTVQQRMKIDNWALRVDVDNKCPHLLKMSTLDSQNTTKPEAKPQNYPVFLVYGLAHGDALTALEQYQKWPEQLQNILLGDIDEEPKRTAILNSILARLLIGEAVFETQDWEARQLRFALQQQTSHYFAIPAKELQRTPNRVLEKQLREMDDLVAQTDYALGRLSQAIKTLQINQDNFTWRLNHLHYEEIDWQIDWKSQRTHPPLLEKLHTSLENVKNHVTYIEGKLTHLKGVSLRWRSYITEHRHSLAEHLGHLGHIIILLIALAKMGELLEKDGKADKLAWLGEKNSEWLINLLNDPNTYFVLIGLYAVFFLYHYGKALLKWTIYQFGRLFKWMKS